MQGLCEETTTLGETLARLAQMIQDGVSAYPTGSPEQQTQEELFKSSELQMRVEVLERCVNVDIYMACSSSPSLSGNFVQSVTRQQSCQRGLAMSDLSTARETQEL